MSGDRRLRQVPGSPVTRSSAQHYSLLLPCLQPDCLRIYLCACMQHCPSTACLPASSPACCTARPPACQEYYPQKCANPLKAPLYCPACALLPSSAPTMPMSIFSVSMRATCQAGSKRQGERRRRRSGSGMAQPRPQRCSLLHIARVMGFECFTKWFCRFYEVLCIASLPHSRSVACNRSTHWAVADLTEVSRWPP